MKRFSLKAVVLAFAAFILIGFAATTEAHAADDKLTSTSNAGWRYDPAYDRLELTPTTGGSIYFYSLKTDGEDTVKKATFTKKLDSATNFAINFSSKTPKADINVALNKSIYMLISDKLADSKAGNAAQANIVINPSWVGTKATLTINYSVVATGSAYFPISAFSFASALDKDKIVDGVGGKWAPAGSEVTIAADPDYGYSDVFEYLEFSLDDQKTWTNMSSLTGATIFAESVKAKPAKFYWRVKGTSASEAKNQSSVNKTAIRPSKTFSLSIGKCAKAPSIKVDVKKMTVALKNGMDYQFVASGTSIVETVDGWTTILPYNKNSNVATTTMDAPTVKVWPKFSADNDSKNYFTKTKVNGIDIMSWFTGHGAAEGLNIAARKSATKSAPASQYAQTGIMLKPAQGPAVSVVSTTGGLKFSVATSSSSTTFEYIIIHAADANKVDVTSVNWTKFDPSKGVIKYNAKTAKYLCTGSTDKADGAAVEKDDIILIRAQGIASKKGSIPVLPSCYTKIVVGAIDAESKVKTMQAGTITRCEIAPID